MSISAHALSVWLAIASLRRKVSVMEIAEMADVRAALAARRTSIKTMLDLLCSKRMLSSSSSSRRFVEREYWYGPECSCPPGYAGVARIQQDDAQTIKPHHAASPDPITHRPVVLRPGASDHRRCPSRYGDRLVYQDSQLGA